MPIGDFPRGYPVGVVNDCKHYINQCLRQRGSINKKRSYRAWPPCYREHKTYHSIPHPPMPTGHGAEPRYSTPHTPCLLAIGPSLDALVSSIGLLIGACYPPGTKGIIRSMVPGGLVEDPIIGIMLNRGVGYKSSIWYQIAAPYQGLCNSRSNIRCEGCLQ